MDRETLLALSKDDLVTLILAQHTQIQVLTARIAPKPLHCEPFPQGKWCLGPARP